MCAAFCPSPGLTWKFARENALKRLQEITEQFVLNVCERRKVPKETSKQAGGAVFTYGSYKLGVNSAGKKHASTWGAKKTTALTFFFA